MVRKYRIYEWVTLLKTAKNYHLFFQCPKGSEIYFAMLAKNVQDQGKRENEINFQNS